MLQWHLHLREKLRCHTLHTVLFLFYFNGATGLGDLCRWSGSYFTCIWSSYCVQGCHIILATVVKLGPTLFLVTRASLLFPATSSMYVCVSLEFLALAKLSIQSCFPQLRNSDICGTNNIPPYPPTHSPLAPLDLLWKLWHPGLHSPLLQDCFQLLQSFPEASLPSRNHWLFLCCWCSPVPPLFNVSPDCKH